jgi:hypothetical protein
MIRINPEIFPGQESASRVHKVMCAIAVVL